MCSRLHGVKAKRKGQKNSPIAKRSHFKKSRPQVGCLSAILLPYCHVNCLTRSPISFSHFWWFCPPPSGSWSHLSIKPEWCLIPIDVNKHDLHERHLRHSQISNYPERSAAESDSNAASVSKAMSILATWTHLTPTIPVKAHSTHGTVEFKCQADTQIGIPEGSVKCFCWDREMQHLDTINLSDTRGIYDVLTSPMSSRT